MNWEALPETAAIFLGALTLEAVLMHHAALSFMVAFPAALFIFNVAVKVLHGRARAISSFSMRRSGSS